MTASECPSCHARLPEQPGRFCGSCGHDLPSRDSVFEPLFRPGPPPAAWPSARGPSQTAVPSNGETAALGYRDTSSPGYRDTTAPASGETATGYGHTASLDYGDLPAPGYDAPAPGGYRYDDPLGYDRPGGLLSPGPPAGPPLPGPPSSGPLSPGPLSPGQLSPGSMPPGPPPPGWPLPEPPSAGPMPPGLLPPAPPLTGPPSPGTLSPGPLYRPAGPGSAQGPGGPRRSRGTLIAVIVVIVLLGIGGWLVLGHGHSSSSGQPGPNASAAGRGSKAGQKAKSGESAELARLGGLLQQSHAARIRVVRATAGVGGCSMAPAAGIGLMNQSIKQRQKVLTELKSVSVSAIPGGHGVVSDLQQVLRHSVAADRDFIGWMQQIQAKGKCPVNTRRSASYQAGLAASGQADRAKAAFLGRWNPLARKAGQPTYSTGSI